VNACINEYPPELRHEGVLQKFWPSASTLAPVPTGFPSTHQLKTPGITWYNIGR
jgi:hypothetical protein